MYNGKSIEAFIDKVNKEAAEAAQKVYDKHRPELIRRIQAQLHKDDVLTVGMGSAAIDRKGKPIDPKSEFTRPLAQTQYIQQDYTAGFDLPYTMTKTSVKD